MTKDQKVTYVQTQVNNARQQQFTREEFVSMFNGIWDGLEVARNAAVDPTIVTNDMFPDGVRG